jgi:4-amino-4-deoxy-L-arabinose transferase-like glycosyltransferase
MNQTRIVVSIFIIALLLRLSALVIFPPPPLDMSAEVAYWGGAQLIVHGDGFRDPSYPVYAPPLYAVFISAFLTLFGDIQLPVKIAQTILDSLTVVFVYLVIKETLGLYTGMLSAAVMSIYPFSIYLSITIASEPLFAFFLSAFMLLALYAIRSQNTYYYCAAGVLLGLATLTRGVTQFFPIVFLAMLMLINRPTQKLLLSYGALCLSFAMVISPWAFRNYTVLEDFVPVGTAGGFVFLQGSTEIFFTSDALKEWPPYYEALLANGVNVPPKGSKPSAIDKFNARAGMENYKSRLRNDPASFVSFLSKKFLRLWYAGESGRNDAIILSVNLPIYLFALAGLVLAWRRKMLLGWVPFSIVAYFILVHWASLPLFRYLMPIMPYLIGFAAFTIISILEKAGILTPAMQWQTLLKES